MQFAFDESPEAPKPDDDPRTLQEDVTPPEENRCLIQRCLIQRCLIASNGRSSRSCEGNACMLIAWKQGVCWMQTEVVS